MVKSLMITAGLASLGLCSCSASESARMLSVNLGDTQSQIGKFAAREADTYLGRMFTNPVDTSGKSGGPDLVLGTPESNALVKAAVDSGKIRLPDGKNADQGYSVKTIGRAIYVAGRTDVGVLYGLYTLLERYGAYFEISRETLPARTEFTVKRLDIRESPAFKYRGLLPWDNFLCGMSGYNLEDYQTLIDRATRMKLNMLQFHFYGGMAFFTETIGGKTVDPACIGMPVDSFRTKGSIGERAFGDLGVFGPNPYVENAGNPRAQAEAVQEMMREVIDHAHGRGWVTSLGFELEYAPLGNPTYTDKPSDEGFGMNLLNPLDPHNAEIAVERYRSLVKTYPESDFYWVWQSEARGILSSNVGHEPGAAEFRQKYHHWAQTSPIWGNRHLGGDIDYAYLFREMANRLTPAERSKLATGGWSIEHLFPNIDTEFPKELIFASLNSFDVTHAVGHQYRSYRVAQNGRRAWMIDWWEFDGEQWFPQFRVGWQEKLYKSCAEYGVESVTLLGWKLSGIEHNVRYLSEFAWNPRLTAKTFYKEYASKVYGAGEDAIASSYEAYDKQAASQPSCGPAPFSPPNMYLSPGWASLTVMTLPKSKKGLEDPVWKASIAECPRYVERLDALCKQDEQTIQLLESTLPKMAEQGQSHAHLMVNRLLVRQLYLKSLSELYQGLMNFDRVARVDGIDKARIATKGKAERAVACARIAIERYADDIRNRNDQGVVAQMNEQYYQVLKRFREDIERTSCATVDWTAFRIHPVLRFDFSSQSPWLYRDGKAEMAVDTVDGRPTLRVKIGGDGVPFNSVHIYPGGLDLNKAPFMDFRIRTKTTEPLTIMFQVADDPNTWHALDLVGEHPNYKIVDSLPEGSIDDGNWHRVTWDLRRLVHESLGRDDARIATLILGSFRTPSTPIEVEFQDFSLGERNLLD